jgi:squalene-hopene/tetraprenyl-beta-curcumene cyclase
MAVSLSAFARKPRGVLIGLAARGKAWILMRNKNFITLLLLVGCGAGALFWIEAPVWSNSRSSPVSYLPKWDAARAAAYLDSRELWWQGWAPAQKDQGTVCISCHTVLPYAMARPALRQAVDETAMSTPEKVLMDSVEKRVRSWTQMAPFYSDRDGRDKAAQSRATEAVLNAVILASYDVRQGHLRPITRIAFDEAWALQERAGENAGGWKWQDFNLAPWESVESGYQGAALLAVQAENAPDGYAAEPVAAPHLERVREYLNREYSLQPTMNQLYVLWASARSPGLLTSAQRKSVLMAIQSLQQPDGGWALSSLDQGNRERDSRWRWIRKQLNISLNPPESDGCATGLVVLVLEEIGTNRQDPMLKHGLQWLESHQDSDGSWRAESLNAKRDPQTEVGRFMTDAATGYAVMALEESRQ